MSHVTEPVTVSPLITRTEEIHNVSGQLSALGYASVFDVVRIPRSQFIRWHQGQLGKQTEKIYDTLIGYAQQVVRHHQHNLKTENNAGLRGPFSVDGPNYSNLFLDSTGWRNRAPDGTPEANDSAVSYLVQLYELAKQLENDSTSTDANKLATRRQDLEALVIDDEAINKEVPQLQLVNNILVEAIKNALPASTSLKDTPEQADVYQTLASCRYPNTLPYHFAHQQILVAQSEINTTLQDLTLPLAADVPAALLAPTTALTNDDLARLQVMASGLGPEQQRILTEAAYFGHYHLVISDVWDAADANKSWFSPYISEALQPYSSENLYAFVLPLQASVAEYTDRPVTLYRAPYEGGSSLLRIEDVAAAKTLVLHGQNNCGDYTNKINNYSGSTEGGAPYSMRLKLQYSPDDNEDWSSPWDGQVTFQFLTSDGAYRHDLTVSLHLTTDGSRYSTLQKDFYGNNYGDNTLTVSAFADMKVFTARADMDTPEVEDMLCTTAGGNFTVVISDNFIVQNAIFRNGHSQYHTAALPFLYGARFIHAGAPSAITITRDPTSFALTLNNLTDDKLDRINRMVRLQRWMDLPFADIDLLVTSAMDAAAKAENVNAYALLMSDDTLRMLGLFRHYQRQYGTSARQFAAWLHLVTPYAITPATPFLDQIFNASKAFDTPFQVDNTAFVYRTEAAGSDAAAGLRCRQIMAALGLNQRQFLLLADKIADNQGGDVSASTLTCNLPTVTAFYRIATLAGTLGLSVEALYALVDAWDASAGDVWAQFAGNPVITAPASGIALSKDILSLLQALAWVTGWQQQAKLPMATCALLSNPPAAVGTNAQLSFIQQIWQRLPATFVDAALLTRSGAPLQEDTSGHSGTIDWLTLFRTGDAGTALLDASGLVTDLPVSVTVKNVVNARNLSDAGKAQAITTLTAVLQQAQATQSGIAITALAQALNVSQSLPALLLRWAGVTPYQWLSRTWNLSPNAPVGELPLVSEGRFGATTTEQDYSLLAADWRDLQWDPATGDLTFTARLSFSLHGTNRISDNWFSLPAGLSASGAITLSSGNWPDFASANAAYNGTNAMFLPTGNDAGDKYYDANTLYALDVPLKGTFSDIAALAAHPLKFGMHCFSSVSGNLSATWALKPTVTTSDTIPADWLATLRDIVRRGMACTQFQLSPAGLQHWLEHSDWFSLSADEQKGTISLQTLYRLSRYHDLLTLVGSAGYTEDDLLAYLRDVNATTALAPADAATRLADLLGWEATEIAAAFVTGVLGHTAASLDDLDVVMRLQQGELASGLTVAQLAEGFALKQTGDASEYAAWSQMGQAMVSGVAHLTGGI
jgi:hypothetical protein